MPAQEAREEEAQLLPGMPAPFELSRRTVGGETVVSFGSRAVYVFAEDDRAMRNLSIVALRQAGVSGIEVARVFGIRPEHVSRLFQQAKAKGSAGLLREMGRPRSLDASGVARAYSLSEKGHSGAEIARELKVSEATICRVLSRRPRPEEAKLELGGTAADGDGEATAVGASGDAPEERGAVDASPTDDAIAVEREDDERDGEVEAEATPSPHLLAATGEGTRQSRYAGAMLLHGFLDRAGAGTVLAALPSPRARAYDASSVLLSATFGFALGSSSAEGTKHLLASDAGAVIGLVRFPHLRTLRPRLAALSELIDPLALQCSLARAMLAVDEAAVEVFYVDDHFVAYTGAAPVQKGWNTRRRHAEAGRDDTVVVDDAWRAICFSSGPPSGLSATMLAPLEQLRSIVGDRRVMIGFDRGGAYPKAFAELLARGYDFVTYRRAPLSAPTVAPSRTWTVVGDARRYLSVADEALDMDGVGAVRQLSVYEHGKVALQILTSDMKSPAAFLARRLVGRWRIENTFKYLEDHHGIHWLCDYEKELSPDTSAVANPKRAAARRALKMEQDAVSSLERAIGATATTSGFDLEETNRELGRLQDELATRRESRDKAQQRLKPLPAKVARNELDPSALRATLRLKRRALQMVCRLLAYNAELDLARSFNAYLEDDDEYRAITRNLLHQPGTIEFAKSAITVTLRRPDAPRIARVLGLLCDQLNADPPRLSGDRRPITYRIGAES